MGLSEKQFQILTFPKTEYQALICDGAVRSGKTSIMALSFVRWAMEEFNNCIFGICGKTVQSAERNIINPLRALRYLPKQGYRLKWKRNDKLLTVSRGPKTNLFYAFGGKDESSFTLIQGITLAGVLLDEVALMPRSFVEQAMARCSVDGARFWFNCNPESPAHWFYEEWVQQPEKHNAMRLHFLMTDNPGLSKETLARYESTYSGVFYDRYVRGLWVVAEGRVYQQFGRNPDRYIYKGPINELDGIFYVSVDYGTVNPCSMGLWCVQPGRAIRVKEWYYDSKKTGKQKTDEEYYKALEELTDGYYIRKVVVDPSAASFMTCIHRHGRFSVWDADNDVLDGIRVVSSLLSAGMLLIHESCEDSIREFGLYRWDEKDQTDKVIKENDHAMDDIRYFCYTILAHEYRWDTWERKGGA